MRSDLICCRVFYCMFFPPVFTQITHLYVSVLKSVSGYSLKIQNRHCLFLLPTPDMKRSKKKSFDSYCPNNPSHTWSRSVRSRCITLELLWPRFLCCVNAKNIKYLSALSADIVWAATVSHWIKPISTLLYHHTLICMWPQSTLITT